PLSAQSNLPPTPEPTMGKPSAPTTIDVDKDVAASSGTVPVRKKVSWLKKCLAVLASLRLTVVLFALSIVLVFCGTLAQIDAGIWSVVGQYFRSLYVWIPFQLFFPRRLQISGGFPFPGGWLLGGLLLVNLLAAHAVRFRVNWRRSGILLIHSGL